MRSRRTYQVIVMPTAEQDLAVVHGTISAESPRTADRFLEELGRAIDSLERFPRRGAAAREGLVFGLELRQLVVSSYRILYCVRGASVFVLRIGHGSGLRLRP